MVLVKPGALSVKLCVSIVRSLFLTSGRIVTGSDNSETDLPEGIGQGSRLQNRST